MRISDWSSDVCSSDLGGRVVAIMPDNFHPGGKHGSLFDRAVSGSHVRLMLRLDKGFTGKGTSVAVRIIVADKGSGGRRPPSTINRASVRSLLEAIREVPPRAVIQPAPLDRKSTRLKSSP